MDCSSPDSAVHKAAVYGTSKSQTWLSDQHFHFQGTAARPQMHCSVQFSRLFVSDSLQPYGLQHTRLPYPSPTPRACSNAFPLSWWCRATIASSVTSFSSCPQSFPALGSCPISWLFISGSQSIGASASASVLPVNIHGWFPLGLTGLISLPSKGLLRVFSSTTIRKHQFFGA